MSVRIRTILAAAATAALFAGPVRAGTDDLAKGEWEGKRTFASSNGAGGGGEGTPSSTDPEEPADGGTATPPDEGEEDDRTVATEPGDGGEDAPEGTPGEEDGDDGTPEGTPGEDDDPPPEADPEEPGDTNGDPLTVETELPSCTARWQYTEKQPAAKLVTAQTLLTFVLFRTDAYAFLCNGYARALSTWYVDWFATSAAHHEEESRFEVTLELANPCPNCVGRITVTGISSLEAKAQLKTSWGGLSSDSSAFAMAHSAWAGPVDCGDRCDATVKDKKSTSTWGASLGPVSTSNVSGQSYGFAVGMAGKGQQATVPGTTATEVIRNRGAAAVYAGGSEDNAQGKARVGYELRMKGATSCGAVCDYFIEQISR